MLKSDISDATLVMLTLAGDQSAYEKLVIRHQSAVTASAMSITKRRFIAEDAAQDAFVTAWIKLNTLKEPEKFASWVRRIARNCALSNLRHYRSFISADEIDLLNIPARAEDGPAEIYYRADSRAQLRSTVGKLPERIKLIIELYYFEGMDVAEIAERLGSAEGTVKHQLHEGRKKLRKELCAMDETLNDTLVQRVMKKVEELKTWQVKSDKSGFESVYNEVLREVEELPESKDKYHALADVLMRGWWWLPGEKNDALFQRIKEAALEGKNDEVMEFIVQRELRHLWGDARINYIKDKQIPELEKAGFKHSLGYAYFNLGNEYYDSDKKEDSSAAMENAKACLAPDDIYYHLSNCALKLQKRVNENFSDKELRKYRVYETASILKKLEGEPRYFCSDTVNYGELYYGYGYGYSIFENASRCDGKFFDISLREGDSYTATDGATLTFVSENETVETPAGTFADCKLFRRTTIDAKCDTYYKDGVGIVKQGDTLCGVTETMLLKEYDIKGGKGLLPIFKGNLWRYCSEADHDVLRSEHTFTVLHTDEDSCIIGLMAEDERFKYDEDDWTNMMLCVRNEYCQSNGKLFDVSFAMERAEALAKTPAQKAHTKAANAVMKRILETDTAFNPNYTATGHWNFFNRDAVYKKDGLTKAFDGRVLSFEWKGFSGDIAMRPLLYNDILGILEDATNCIWNDEWKVGFEKRTDTIKYGETVQTTITITECDPITTKAGTFENCIKVAIDIRGLEDRQGLEYRGGKKTYYFAEGVGIIRTENEYASGSRTAIYELSDYQGTGNGYMPIESGMMRRYDALDLTDGFEATSIYTYEKDENGDLLIFEDRTGIKNTQLPITSYSSIQSEIEEQKLMEAKDWKSAQALYSLNTLKLMCHTICRPSRNIHTALRSIEIQGFNLRLMEQFGDGNVPPAWYGVYAWTALIRAAAFFGNKQKDEGYEHLEKSLCYYEKHNSIKDGEELELGNSLLFGGAKFVKGKNYFLLASGEKEPAEYDYRFNPHKDQPYVVLTMPHGWEWFNSVRKEERFKQLVDKAKDISEISK